VPSANQGIWTLDSQSIKLDTGLTITRALIQSLDCSSQLDVWLVKLDGAATFLPRDPHCASLHWTAQGIHELLA
jgi:hypothetical protein